MMCVSASITKEIGEFALQADDVGIDFIEVCACVLSGKNAAKMRIKRVPLTVKRVIVLFDGLVLSLEPCLLVPSVGLVLSDGVRAAFAYLVSTVRQ